MIIIHMKNKMAATSGSRRPHAAGRSAVAPNAPRLLRHRGLVIGGTPPLAVHPLHPRNHPTVELAGRLVFPRRYPLWHVVNLVRTSLRSVRKRSMSHRRDHCFDPSTAHQFGVHDGTAAQLEGARDKICWGHDMASNNLIRTCAICDDWWCFRRKG